MFRVLATSRFLEIRCQDLYEGLREEQERCRDQARKKKAAQTELAAMKTVLVESTVTLKKAEARFKSMHRQYKDNLDETLALRVALDDERVVTGDLQHLLKNKEATIAQLNSRLTATELRERLATAEVERRQTRPAPSTACPADPWLGSRRQSEDSPKDDHQQASRGAWGRTYP
jgi:chromosome segregation ATPase